MNDDRWLERVRDEFRPEPMSPERAVAFRRALDERIERSAGARRLALPAFAAAAAAAAALWLAWPVTSPTQQDTSVASAALDSFVDPDQSASELAERPDYLPADYQGLALLLEDDTADR
jgi:hypothetical protein